MNVDQIRAKIAKIRFDLAALECPSITSDDVADVSDAYQDRLEYNGSGIAEGRDLEAQCFNLTQMPNRITNYC